MLGKGCANSRPGGHRVPEMMWTDGPGFSLCAVPLKSSGPGFQGMWQRSDDERKSGGLLCNKMWDIAQYNLLSTLLWRASACF